MNVEKFLDFLQQIGKRERMAEDRYRRSLSKHGGSALAQLYYREKKLQRQDRSGCADIGVGFCNPEHVESWLGVV